MGDFKTNLAPHLGGKKLEVRCKERKGDRERGRMGERENIYC
jgi:hypothetical protein